MDPELIVERFNECINTQNVDGLSQLMAEDHTFIDREGSVQNSKRTMLRSWSKFFTAFPKYKNTFTRIEKLDDRVAILGHAFWSAEKPHDPAIWTAIIVDDKIKEWRIYPDTPGNRTRFRLT